MDDRNTRQFEISSSDGWDSIRFGLTNGRLNQEVVVSISAGARFWDRRVHLEDNPDLVDDFAVTFHQAALSRTRLLGLLDELRAWMVENKTIDVELVDGSLPRVRIFVGALDDLISSTSRPVFVLSYSDTRIESSIKFVVDQSCIRLFMDGLEQALR
jgi:hypothetical protein